MLFNDASGVADRLDAEPVAAAAGDAAAAGGPSSRPSAAALLPPRARPKHLADLAPQARPEHLADLPPRARPEHLAEVMALSRLLGRRRFGRAVYVGGGYSRFSPVLRGCADCVTVAAAGPLDVDDSSADLAVMISVLHQRPEPADQFAEIARILRPGAPAIIAAANVLHGAGRDRYRRSPQAVTGSAAVGGGRVGHHPETLMLQLAVCGLRVERLLSVSNLRHPVLDRILPEPVIQAAEFAVQAALAPAYFGPVMFFLARKRGLA
jgi:SAM-dependent methyltransferase